MVVIDFINTLFLTLKNLVPIVLLFGFFQFVVIKQPLGNMPKILVGGLYVLIGLTLFLVGLEEALFPLGKIMAAQLTDPDFLQQSGDTIVFSDWKTYYWVYIFAAAIGFATTVAEPSLIAVAYKAADVSGGSIGQWGLRITVAIGVAFGIALGTFRIVTGTPLYLYIIAGYLIVLIQTFMAPKTLIPLAYDSGGVTTSTVTVPVVAALGLGLSAAVPGRNPAIDGFGLIAFASLFPIISVLGYAQIAQYYGVRKVKKREEKRHAI